jgi:hypothetical protein
MTAVKLNQASLTGLRSILSGVFNMSNSDMVCAIQENHACFGQRHREFNGKVYGHQNLVTVRVYDTGTTSQYDVVVKHHQCNNWKMEIRTESLFEVAEMIAAKIVK